MIYDDNYVEYADTYTVFVCDRSMVCYDDDDYSSIKITDLSKGQAFEIMRLMSTFGAWCTIVREKFYIGTDGEDADAD